MGGSINILDSEPKREKPKNKGEVEKESHAKEMKLKAEVEAQKIFNDLKAKLPTLQGELILDKAKWDKFNAIPEVDRRIQYLFNDISPNWANIGVLEIDGKIDVRMKGYTVYISVLANGKALPTGLRIYIKKAS